MRIKGGHLGSPITHRLLPLGITSLFDLPEDPLNLLNSLLFVLYRRIYILSVNPLCLISIFGTPESTLRATQISGKPRDNSVYKGHRRSTNCNPSSLLNQKKGGPEREHLPSSGHGPPPRKKRIKERTGGLDIIIVSGAGEKSGLNFARITREQHELRAKVSHMVIRQQKQPRKRAREAEQTQDN